MHLDDRRACCPGIMVHLRRHGNKSTRSERLGFAFVELVAHSRMEASGHYGHVLGGRVMVGRVFDTRRASSIEQRKVHRRKDRPTARRVSHPWGGRSGRVPISPLPFQRSCPSQRRRRWTGRLSESPMRLYAWSPPSNRQASGTIILRAAASQREIDVSQRRHNRVPVPIYLLIGLAVLMQRIGKVARHDRRQRIFGVDAERA